MERIIKNSVVGFLFLFSIGITHIKAQTGVQTKTPTYIYQVDGKKDNAETPTADQLSNDFIVTPDGEVGVGVPTPKVKVDVRSLDPKGIIGLGTTTQTAAQAREGALRYHPTNKVLEYSDGVAWHAIPKALPPKSLVLANKSTTQSISQNNATEYISGWNKKEDAYNDFNTSTGTFTAPRDGFYIVSFNIALSSGSIANDSRIETIIEGGTDTNNISKFINVNTFPSWIGGSVSNIVAGNCSAVFNLKAGNTIRFRVWHNLGGSRSIDTSNGGTNNSISIYEL